MKKKYVLKDKKRFTIFIAFLILFMGISIFAKTVYGYKETTYKTITVKYGDTLWAIASDNCTEGDMRVYIHKIKTLNNMSTCEIYYGTELKLPEK